MKWNRTIRKIVSGAVLAGTILGGCVETTQVMAAQNVSESGLENGLELDMRKVSSYVSGYSDMEGGVAEIISYDAKNQKAWVVNGATGKLDILTLAEDGRILNNIEATSLDICTMVENNDREFVYGDMTSVAVNSEMGIAAVALQAEAYDQSGRVALLSTEGALIAVFEAGCQPDMVTFTPDGSKILVANEGEPRMGFGEGVTDPAGSVTVIFLNAEHIEESSVMTLGFEKFDAEREALVADGILMVKDNLPSVDFEPEYIATTNETALIALQENNAIAVLDLVNLTFTGVYSLGFKDLSLTENALDLVGDGVYEAKTYADTVSAYMPDGIAVYETEGVTYLFTANEGDAREWGSDATEYCNESKETLISTDGMEAAKVRVIDAEVTDGMPEGKKVMYGGRSFSVYRVEEDGLTQMFDSGNDFERLTAAYVPEYFNCSNDDNEYDSRSQKKGPEPESVVVGEVDGRTYAFVALERIGGIMVYDITNPEDITYSNYINTRDFSEDPSVIDMENAPDSYLTGDVAPEGMYFVNEKDSPIGKALLLTAFEVSGTVAAYTVEAVEENVILLGTSWADAGENQVMSIGETADINYYGVKKWISNDYVAIWLSSDETVATVNKNGVVTVVGEGEAYINLVLKHKKTEKLFTVKPVKVIVE
ncbi:MAG: choice-of-anchor I family protein [Lachnospiraceae bacterium]|nr:choice-of-anchor I family protein [Lachnospiraceae bacterium]